MQIDAQDAFDIRFFEAVARRNRQDVEALELLGGLYSKYEMAKQALRIDRRLARLQPDNARIQYNLACSLCLLGRKRDAVKILGQAFDLGYDDFTWMLQDPDLEQLRGYPEFEDLISSVTG